MRSGRQRSKAVFGAALAIVSLSGCGLLDNGDDSAAADDAIPIATAPPVEVQTAADDGALVAACVQYVPVAAVSGSPRAQALGTSMAQAPNALTMKCTEWLQPERLLLRQMSSRLAARAAPPPAPPAG